MNAVWTMGNFEGDWQPPSALHGETGSHLFFLFAFFFPLGGEVWNIQKLEPATLFLSLAVREATFNPSETEFKEGASVSQAEGALPDGEDVMPS